MTPPHGDYDAAGDRSRVRRIAAIGRRELGKAVAVFLLVFPVTFVVLRAWGWDVLIRDFNASEHARIIARTPVDVLARQVEIALVVGVVFAAEAVLYGARDVLPPGRWWAGETLAISVRALGVVAGVALFPIGALIGYDVVFPVVFDGLVADDAALSVFRLTSMAAVVSIASGVAAQATLVAAALGFSRVQATDGLTDDRGD